MTADLMDEMALDDQAMRPIIEGSQIIGGVYYMNYDECVIVTNDRWKDVSSVASYGPRGQHGGGPARGGR